MIGGLFIDNANLIHSLAQGRKPLRIDFSRLAGVLAREAGRLAGEPVEFRVRTLYATWRPGTDRSPREAFYRHLRNLGWSVAERPAKEYRDGHWEDKGSDLEIALDAHGMALRKYIDAVAILTDDADFAALYERLPLGIKGFSVGWERSMARELRTSATPIYLEPLLGEIEIGSYVRADPVP